MASIVDRPKESAQDDLLAIEKYTNGLIKFIEHSGTPITIGIQGEWGSGKTSLLNTIKDQLCDQKDAQHFPIWLNTWEYSLLSSPDETLIKVISGLVLEIGNLTKNENIEKSKKATAALGSLIKNFGSFAGGVSGKIAQMSGEALEKYMSENPLGNSIQELRKALQEEINTALDKSNKKSFIFFIDDLDRLDPSVAVNILELFKNIFDLERCIFVLAIDYGVVVKGLQSKFGKMTDENEWEFRAFFDKIIQLPFSMPISSYNIKQYLQSILVKVDYFSQSELEDEERLKQINNIVEWSVGTNPRALKRLANSVALIEIIRGDDELINTEERVIEFALICIQIAYPVIYRLIQKESDFTTWDDEFIFPVLKNKNIDESDLELLKSSPEFDDEWEQNVWKICQINSFLKQRVYQISKLLNFIIDHVPNNEEEMGMVLDKLLSMSSVTSVSSEDTTSNRKKHRRLSAKQKAQISNELENFIDEKVKSKYNNYFSTHSASDFEIRLKGDVRSVWLPIKIDDIEIDLCVYTDHQYISMYVNTKVANEKTIAWFEKNMSDIYKEIKYDKFAKDGKKVAVLEKYRIDDRSQVMDAYKKSIEDIFNTFLSQISQR